MKKILKKIFTSVILVVFLSTNTFGLPPEKGSGKVQCSSYSATITWVTDKPSTSQIEYGPQLPYDQTTPADTDLVIYHKITLTDLNPLTAYHYRIKSRDARGNEAVSDDLTFRTLAPPPEDQPPRISDIEAAVIVAAGPDETSQDSAPPKSKEETAKQLIKEEEPIKKALTEKGGILLKKGKWQIEPTTTYVHTSSNRIAIAGYVILPLIIGEISTEKVKRDIFIQSIVARYGLNNNTQLDLSIPFRYQRDRVVVESPASETVRDLAGLGDISMGVSHQFAYEQGWRPDLIAGLSVKTASGKEPYGRDIGLGTGHWAVKASMVAVKSSDPAVLFGSLGYTYNIQRDDITDLGKIKPGDTINYSLGLAFALNYQIALSFQLQQALTQTTQLNGDSIANSFTNVAKIKTGLTWSMSKNSSCEVSVAYGLTTDSPDLIVEVSFPFKF